MQVLLKLKALGSNSLKILNFSTSFVWLLNCELRFYKVISICNRSYIPREARVMSEHNLGIVILNPFDLEIFNSRTEYRLIFLVL